MNIWHRAKNYTFNNTASFVSYNVVMEVTMNFTIFYDVTPCTLVGIYYHFGGIYCLQLQGRSIMKMETRLQCHTQEDNILQPITRLNTCTYAMSAT